MYTITIEYGPDGRPTQSWCQDGREANQVLFAHLRELFLGDTGVTAVKIEKES